MSTIEIAYRSRLTGRTPFDYVWTRNIGVQNTFKMICQEDSKMRALLKRCRNNGILEYWNDDILLKNPIFQFSRRSQPVPSRICGAAKAGKATLAKSAIPSFHFPKAPLSAKPLAMIIHAHLENCFWTDVNPEAI